MRSYITIYLCVLMGCTVSPAKAEGIRLTQGDTLWDIAKRNYGDPLLWPCIHKANPGITNPNLLLLPSSVVVPEKWECTRKLQLVSGKKKPEPAPASSPNPLPTTVKTEKKESHSTLPVVPQAEETTVFNNGGYQLVPVKMIVDQEKRSASIKTKKIDSTTEIDEGLLRTLMPKDPRVSRVAE